MSTSLHAVFDVISGNVFYFIIVISNICGRKMQLSESSQNSISEKSIFGQFEVIFSQAINFSQRVGGYFLLVHSKWSILTKNELSSWSQKKVI